MLQLDTHNKAWEFAAKQLTYSSAHTRIACYCGSGFTQRTTRQPRVDTEYRIYPSCIIHPSSPIIAHAPAAYLWEYPAKARRKHNFQYPGQVSSASIMRTTRGCKDLTAITSGIRRNRSCNIGTQSKFLLTAQRYIPTSNPLTTPGIFVVKVRSY